MGYLTVRKVENAKPGRYTDSQGLILHVRPAGSKYWVLGVQVNGRRRDIGLGSVSQFDSLSDLDEVPLLQKCVLTLAEARLKAATLRQIAKSGRDPVAELMRDRTPVPNFAQAARHAYEAKLPEWSAKTADAFISTLEKHAFPQLGSVLVSDVDAPTIAKALTGIWMSTPHMGRKVRQRIGLVLNFAEAQSWRSSSMPNEAVSMLLPTRLRDGLTLYVDNASKLEKAVEQNSGMKRSALETTGLLKDAAAAGIAKGKANEPAQGREPPERDRSIVKPFEIGI